MDTAITMLRRLWSRRGLSAAVCLLAVLAALSVLFKLPAMASRGFTVGVATDQLLVDTPESQVVEISPRGTATISEQTLLLASLMVDGAIKTEIAQNAGLRPNQITGVNNAVTQPTAAGPASVAPPSGQRAYILTTQVLTDSAGDDLPIIQLTAQAPTTAAAKRLATAAVTSVRSYLASLAASRGIPSSRELKVSELGLSVTTQSQGPSKALAFLAFLFVLGLGWGAILGIPALARGWRFAADREKLQAEGLEPAPGLPPHLVGVPVSAIPEPMAITEPVAIPEPVAIVEPIVVADPPDPKPGRPHRRRKSEPVDAELPAVDPHDLAKSFETFASSAFELEHGADTLSSR